MVQMLSDLWKSITMRSWMTLCVVSPQHLIMLSCQFHCWIQSLSSTRDCSTGRRTHTDGEKRGRDPCRPLLMAYQRFHTFSLFLFSLPVLINAISGLWDHQTLRGRWQIKNGVNKLGVLQMPTEPAQRSVNTIWAQIHGAEYSNWYHDHLCRRPPPGLCPISTPNDQQGQI